MVRAVAQAGLPAALCTVYYPRFPDPDYANPIEPSARGGARIARAVARLVAEHDPGGGRTAVFTR